MPQIIVKQPFKFAHHGYRVQEFEPAAEPVETTDECAELAVLHGWAQLVPAAEQTSANLGRRRGRGRGRADRLTP